MNDFSFEPLTESNIDDVDLALFSDCAAASEGREFGHLLWEDLCDGKIIGWKWIGPKGRGMLLTKIKASYTRKELYIFSVAGKGYMRYMPEIFETLQTFGREYDCTVLTGDVERKGLMRAYESFGAKEVYRRYEVSLTHS